MMMPLRMISILFVAALLFAMAIFAGGCSKGGDEGPSYDDVKNAPASANPDVPNPPAEAGAPDDPKRVKGLVK